MSMKQAPAIKKSAKAIKDEFIEKAMRPVRGQIHLFHVKGVKEKTLTWRDLRSGVFRTKLVRHGDLIELPYHYVKYINEHGTLKQNKRVPMRLSDKKGTKTASVHEDERLYYFMVRDVMSAEDLADLEPSNISIASFN